VIKVNSKEKRIVKDDGFTLVEVLIAISVLALFIIAGLAVLQQGQKEASVMSGKLMAQTGARYAFLEMCKEIREATVMVLKNKDHELDIEDEYKIKSDSQSEISKARYGPPTNYLIIEDFNGEIVMYYYAQGELRKRNYTLEDKIKDKEKYDKVILKGVIANDTKPSIFSVARYFPGKQPSSVLITLNIQEEQGSKDKVLSLVSSVFLRNVQPFLEEY